MKAKSIITIVATVLVVGVIVQSVDAAGRKRGGKARENTSNLSQAEVSGLLYMREEEKLAHDVYTALYDRWKIRVFNNIAQSEQRHTDKILGLLERYDLKDPVLGFGKFSDPSLQELYDSLIKKGSESLVDALYVGALIEEVDMVDIVEKMEAVEHADILRVYSNLLRGSENHLNAFVQNMEKKTDEIYQAQQLPQEDVDQILNR